MLRRSTFEISASGCCERFLFVLEISHIPSNCNETVANSMVGGFWVLLGQDMLLPKVLDRGVFGGLNEEEFFLRGLDRIGSDQRRAQVPGVVLIELRVTSYDQRVASSDRRLLAFSVVFTVYTICF